MGADIHLYIEYKEKHSTEWQLHHKHKHTKEDGLQELGVGHRNYVMFSVLANVRGSGDCIYYPRGLPKDISLKLKIDLDEWLEHTPHWLTLKEFQKCLDKVDQIRKKELKLEYREATQDLNDGSITQKEFDDFCKEISTRGVSDKKKLDDIFFSYEDYSWYEYNLPSYSDIIPYLECEYDERLGEHILLGLEPPEDYDYRLVFYFDS